MDQSPGTVSTSQIDVDINKNSVSLFGKDTDKKPLFKYTDLRTSPSAPHFPTSSLIPAYLDYLSPSNKDSLRNFNYVEPIWPFHALISFSALACVPKGCCYSMNAEFITTVALSIMNFFVNTTIINGVDIVFWRTPHEASAEFYHFAEAHGETFTLRGTQNSDRWALYNFLIKEVLEDPIRNVTIIRACICFNRFQRLCSLEPGSVFRELISGSAVDFMYALKIYMIKDFPDFGR